jgi:hypothetical protein
MYHGNRYIGRIMSTFALVMLTLTVGLPHAHAQPAGIEPQAEKTLRRMTDYLGGLKQFSVRTQVTLEDLLESGHRVDYDISSSVTISRPNKLRAERRGDVIEQTFYYDGKTLTLHSGSQKVYATDPAPATIEELLDYARDSLGLGIPAADLVYRNAFQLLMKDVTFATIIGKTVIGGVKCDHLLFSRPGVDFQVWVAEGGQPLPYKYVVTDRLTPAPISVTTVMSNWSVAPRVTDASFKFVAPKGTKSIIFLLQNTASDSGR